VSKTIHAGTTRDDNKVVVRIADPRAVSGNVAEIEIPALKALALAAELIHAANYVLEGTL
jgi:hypothetical protein